MGLAGLGSRLYLCPGILSVSSHCRTSGSTWFISHGKWQSYDSKRNYSSVFSASSCIEFINIPLPEANHVAQPKVSRVRMDILPTLLLGSVELHIVDLSIILFWGAGVVKKTGQSILLQLEIMITVMAGDKMMIEEGSCLSPSFLTLSYIHPEIFILNGNSLISWSHWNVLFFFPWAIEEHFLVGRGKFFPNIEGNAQ